MSVVHGYKVFLPDWTCRPEKDIVKQYAPQGKFEEDVDLNVCHSGMHFCKKAADCFGYYEFDSKNHVAEVIAYGEVLEDEDKCCTNKLEIVREIPWHEVLDIVNIGKKCAGSYNSGNCNSGNWNIGYRNSGDYNSGDYNSGNCNSGNCNSGHRNSGNRNSGYRNSGNWNSGDYNSGDWNKCNFSSGCFNTVELEICLFNKPSDWTYMDWVDSKAYTIMSSMPISDYIYWKDMTDIEKIKHPEAEITGGYLKETNSFDKRNEWWQKLSEESKKEILSIPNFDAEIFKEITGVDINAKVSN